MIRYMLDTDTCIAIIKHRPEPAQARLTALSVEEVGISGIVAAELWYGVAFSQKKKQNETALKYFLTGNEREFRRVPDLKIENWVF